SRRNRDSVDECCRSGPSSASGSRKTATASSKVTPCFAALASAFRGSHSNTYYVYTKCRGMLRRQDDQAAVERRKPVAGLLCFLATLVSIRVVDRSAPDSRRDRL